MQTTYRWTWGGVTVLVVLGALGWYFATDGETPEGGVSDEVRTEEVRLEEEGVAFSYRTAPEGYVLEEVTERVRERVEGTEVVSSYQLMSTRDREILDRDEGGREGPPTINLTVFTNPANQSASMWVDAFPLFSNIGLVIGAVDRDAVVGGANAVRYRADGLYLNEHAVVASGGYIYHFVGSFLEEDSALYRDFGELLESVTFIPQSDGAAGKIDVRAVCESALIYMSFASGEEAEAFVEACVAGEHPEVIERWRTEQGLEGAVI